MAGLDDKSANRLSPVDQFRILGNDPSMAYLNFGMVFLAAKRNELAVKALERGLVYDEDNRRSRCSWPIPCSSSTEASRPWPWSIGTSSARRRGRSLRALAKVLKALEPREGDHAPAGSGRPRDSKNVPLQYVLADRYRETGQIDKAEALYKELLTSQPTPQTYRAWPLRS